MEKMSGVTGNDVSVEGTILCRDSWLTLPYELFSNFTCVKCFVQVFFNSKDLSMDLSNPFFLYHRDNKSTVYVPDPDSPDSRVCRDWLNEEECSRWKQCCRSARECCLNTQREAAKPREGLNDTGVCPATWDGVACWFNAPAGAIASHTCPEYYIAENIGWLNPQATRNCTVDGKWSINPESSMKWEISNYDQCFNTQTNINVLKASLYIDFIGNGISILFLLSAICLILGSRPLRLELTKKTGLRLHFNLFVSVLLMGIFTVAFHSVYFDAFTAAGSATAIPLYHNNAVWCRIVHAFTKYFKSTTYMAMFCEGLFLYKRISNVMRMGFRDSMLKYLIITWVAPALLVLTYSIVRLSMQRNERCWIDHGLSYIEYIIIVPNILSLVCNLVFLISIEWMLCTKMRSDTSDRRVEVLRHALRATLSLIPIFGLQFLFIIYRPQHWPPYEIIIAFFTSTQGILVAILYCFATKEVRRELSAMSRKCTGSRRDSLTPSVSSTRSTRLSRLSNASTFFANLGQKMSRRKESIRNSLPDLISYSGYADRRGSSVSRGSRGSRGRRSRRDSGLSMGASDETITPDRSRTTSETGSLIGQGSAGGTPTRRLSVDTMALMEEEEGEQSPVWVKRNVVDNVGEGRDSQETSFYTNQPVPLLQHLPSITE